MNLKYYLRGLGIGIVVTALLMSFTTPTPQTMTDEEIKERAAALGMVEQKVLADVSTPVPESNAEPEVAEKPVNVAPPVVTEVPIDADLSGVTTEPATTTEPEVLPTEEPVTEPTETPATAPAEGSEQSESITLTIKSGETSWSISKALYEAGVVENASDFDTYLCQNGYDKTIRTGTYEISKSATYEEIAKEIAR